MTGTESFSEAVHIIGAGLAGSEAAWQVARSGIPVVLHEMRPDRMTEAGGWWWEVAVPEVSDRDGVRKARAAYEDGKRKQQP